MEASPDFAYCVEGVVIEARQRSRYCFRVIAMARRFAGGGASTGLGKAGDVRASWRFRVVPHPVFAGAPRRRGNRKRSGNTWVTERLVRIWYRMGTKVAPATRAESG